MSFTHVCVFVTLVTYTLSLPLTKNSEVKILSDDSAVTDNGLVAVYAPIDPLANLDLLKNHRIIRRAPRSGGIINGGACAEGEWQLPNGQCAPCQGQNTPECDGVTEKDYYDDNEV